MNGNNDHESHNLVLKTLRKKKMTEMITYSQNRVHEL